MQMIAATMKMKRGTKILLNLEFTSCNVMYQFLWMRCKKWFQLKEIEFFGIHYLLKLRSPFFNTVTSIIY
jgi:hypothetical protein